MRANKKALFQQLAAAAGAATGLTPRRSSPRSTSARSSDRPASAAESPFPHGKIEGLDGVFGYFARLTTPIDFQSVDDLPVDLVFMILSPPDAGADHLKALAAVSRALRDRDIVAKLRGARSRDAIFALLAGVESRNAA